MKIFKKILLCALACVALMGGEAWGMFGRQANQPQVPTTWHVLVRSMYNERAKGTLAYKKHIDCMLWAVGVNFNDHEPLIKFTDNGLLELGTQGSSTDEARYDAFMKGQAWYQMDAKALDAIGIQDPELRKKLVNQNPTNVFQICFQNILIAAKDCTSFTDGSSVMSEITGVTRSSITNFLRRCWLTGLLSVPTYFGYQWIVKPFLPNIVADAFGTGVSAIRNFVFFDMILTKTFGKILAGGPLFLFCCYLYFNCTSEKISNVLPFLTGVFEKIDKLGEKIDSVFCAFEGKEKKKKKEKAEISRARSESESPLLE